MRMIILAAAAAVFAGCATVDPITMERTERDQEEYVPPEPIHASKERDRVAIVSKVIEHQREGERYHDEFLAKTMEAATAKYFSSLGRFRAVGSVEGLVLDGNRGAAESGRGADGAVAPEADYLLVIESSAAFIAKQGWKKTSHSKKARGVQIESDFRLIDNRQSKEVVFSMQFRSSAECGKGDIRTAISDAVALNAEKFARVVSARYLAPGRVTETRGSGRCAKVTIGKNYMLNVGTVAMPAARVDFFAYERNKITQRLEKVVVAHGTVISSDKSEAWVEVDADWIDKTTHLATYNVRKGHFVKITEEGIMNEEEDR